MNFGLLGTDFTKAPLNFLEKVYLNRDHVKEYLSAFPESSPIKELVILMTCNRVEYYYSCDDPIAGGIWLKEIIAQRLMMPIEKIESHMKVVTGKTAVKHLFEVASGTESMVFGESEILGQLKTSYFLAQKLGRTKSLLNKVFQMAISVGKRVRDETNIARGAYSISSVAIEVMKTRLPSFREKKILVIGAGIMGFRLVSRLSELKQTNLTLANRTESKGKLLADRFGARIMDLDEALKNLGQFDVIFLAVDYSGFLIQVSHLNAHANPLLIVDLGVPRNVDPDLGSYTHIKLVSIDGLNEMAEKTATERKKEATIIDLLIEEELHNLTHWQNYQHA